MVSYWRVRLKEESWRDRSREAWARNCVGIWYGAWAASDLEDAYQNSSDKRDIQKHLTDVLAQRKLKWDGGVPLNYVDTAIRFRNIQIGDWVILYLADQQELALAQICSRMASQSDSEFNTQGEIFKYRQIENKKTFRLSRLPDSYWLIPSQGRSNVHQFRAMGDHIRMLAECASEDEVNDRFHDMPANEYLNFIGDSEWEALCAAYLIFESQFIPSGLSVGKTLAVLDIVGRRKSDGARIFAQCKKHAFPQTIPEEFHILSNQVEDSDLIYFFAFGGCADPAVPENMKIVDANFMLEWLNSDHGRLYRDRVYR